MPASGGLMIAVNWSIPNMPRFETENVAPVYSSGLSLRSRARFASSRASREISLMRLRSASKIDRRDQPVFDRDGHAEVHAVELADLVAEPVRVHFGVLRERGRDGLDDDVVDRHLELVAQLGHRGAHLGDALQVELGGEIERRDRADRLGEPPRDRLPHLA